MADEHNLEQHQEQSSETPSTSQTPPRRKRPPSQKRRQQSALQYIVILFTAAFALMLFTLLMERRENQAQIDNLEQTSVSATQRLQEILNQNEYYKDRVDAYVKEINALEMDKNTLSGYITNLELSLDRSKKSLEAMDWFWQINEAFTKKKPDYKLCQELIDSLDQAGLTPYLPKTSVTSNGRFSPADRLEEIREAIH